jgi:transposase
VNWCEVSDELWERLKPLLPKRPRRRRWPGRKPLDDRACLNGILFVLSTGIRWDRLPQQLGYGSGRTCWRRLRDWQQARVWAQAHARLLAELHAGGTSTGPVRSPTAPTSGPKGGRSDRPKPGRPGPPGSKHHLLTDPAWIPLAVRVTAANRNDITQLLPLIQQVPPVRGRRRRRPDQLLADRGYDSAAHREALRTLGIRPVIATRRVEHVAGGGWLSGRSPGCTGIVGWRCAGSTAPTSTMGS